MLGNPVGLLHEALRSNAIVKDSNLGTDTEIQSLLVSAEKSYIIPSTSHHQSVELQGVVIGGRREETLLESSGMKVWSLIR